MASRLISLLRPPIMIDDSETNDFVLTIAKRLHLGATRLDVALEL
jgi:hypothetical protein